MYTFISIIVAVFLIILTYIKWSHQYWKRRNMPYLEPRFPGGNLTFGNRITVGLTMKRIYDEIKNRQLKHCGIYFFTRPLYIAKDLDYLKNIMTKDFSYFVDRGMYYNERDDPISAHLFALGGTKWRNLRQKLTPTFTSAKMKTMFNTMIDCVELMVESINQKLTVDKPIDIKEIVSGYSTDIIGSCAFGLDCNSIKEDDSPFRIYGRQVFTSTKLRILRMVFAANHPNVARFLRIHQIPRKISKFFTETVKNTIRYREENNVERKDFLQLLINLRQDENPDSRLTINEIVAQSFVFFLAGFETSSTTIAFALYELAKNQTLQNDLRSEIQLILEKYDGRLTYEAINDMKYLGQIFDETLRKYPPLPYVSRICVKDYKIPDEDLIIKKGTRVIIPILGIHRDEEHYPNPELFDPERFSEENKRNRHQYAHIPFGEGPRICIGMRFALMQSKVALATLIKNYKFTINSKTQEPLEFDPNSFVLTAKGGIWLNATNI